MFENSPPVPIEAIEINTELVVSEEKIGYYFFKDRHDEASGDIYKFDREVVISSRYSTNYIISALDVENKTLYYFQLDT